MRKRTFLAIAALVLGAVVLVQPARALDYIIEPLDYDFPSEVKAAADQGKNLVVMFHLNGCPYCDKMRKRVHPHPKVVEFYGQKFHLIELNIKGDLDVVTPDGENMTEKAYAEKMLVRATPVYVFFAKDGKDVLRLTGYNDVEMFLAAGRYVSSEAYADGTSFLSFVRAGK